MCAHVPSQHIESWLSSAQDHERERAVTATAHMLAYYLDNLTVKVRARLHTHLLSQYGHHKPCVALVTVTNDEWCLDYRDSP